LMLLVGEFQSIFV